MSTSRMEKYDNDYSNMSRTKKNQSIYNSTDIGELSRFKANTNVSVISDAGKEIDINKIRNYLKAHNEEESEVGDLHGDHSRLLRHVRHHRRHRSRPDRHRLRPPAQQARRDLGLRTLACNYRPDNSGGGHGSCPPDG